jgi:hypothetical protein
VSRRWTVLIAVALLGAALLVILRTVRYEPPVPGPAFVEAEHTRWVDLYFPSEKGGLVMEAREVRAAGSANEEAMTVLKELFRGPLSSGAHSLSPGGVGVERFFLDTAGTAYVSLDSAIVTDPPGGTRSEQLCLEAIVRTVVSNVRGARRLQLVIGGRVPETLWGHLRTDMPLPAPATASLLGE